MQHSLFSVFLSYSIKDRNIATDISEELRTHGIEVVNFFDTEPLGEFIEDWIADNMADVDCVLVLLTSNSLANPTWIEREVGLAANVLSDQKSLLSNIIPICSNISINELSQPFQPRDYMTSKPLGPTIIWSQFNCLMIDRDGLSLSVEKFIKNQQPCITLIKNPEFSPQESLIFSSAIHLYSKLLPDESVRDPTTNIIEWINSSWDDNGYPQHKEKFLHYFIVQHIKFKAIALLWCSVDTETGFAFMNFWGTHTGHRSRGRSLKFASLALKKILESSANLNNIFFACEPVDWISLDQILDSLNYEKHETAETALLSEDARSAQLNRLPPTQKKHLLEEMRKLRRFIFYSSGAGISRFFPAQKVKIFFYINKEKSGSKFDFEMASFIQPPIHEPFDSSGCSNLWLFNITIDANPVSASEAATWIYEDFLLYTLEPLSNSSTGYSEYLTQFQKLNTEDFSSRATPHETKPREWFKPYIQWLNVMKKHMLEEQKLGVHSDRWDIQL